MWMVKAKKMRNIVILGNTSFIGLNISEKLNNEFNIFGFNSKNCNLLEYKHVEKTLGAIENIDCIIFCSSITRLKENTIFSLEKNVLMALNVAKFIEKYPIKQLIFLSSIDIYGNTEEEYTEDLLLNPNDYYAKSKSISEIILKEAVKKYNTKLFIPRLSGVFGKNDKNKSTIYDLVSSALNKKEITLFNNGEDTRDYIYIDFLIEIIKNAINKEYEGILNIATGKSYSIKTISQLIINLIDNNVKLILNNDKNSSRNKKINFNISKLKNSNLINNNLDIKDYLQLYIGCFDGK